MTKQTLTATMAALAVLLLGATLPAQPPHDHATVPEILALADASYAVGDLTAALERVEQARALLEAELDGDAGAGRAAPSNAAQLRHSLGYYHAVAAGREFALDEAAAFLAHYLDLILFLERGPDRPHQIGDLSVGTWGDGRVHRIGDVDIGHWGDGRIHRIGRYDIWYDAYRRPRDMGGIEFEYRSDEREPREVADVDLR